MTHPAYGLFVVLCLAATATDANAQWKHQTGKSKTSNTPFGVAYSALYLKPEPDDTMTEVAVECYGDDPITVSFNWYFDDDNKDPNRLSGEMIYQFSEDNYHRGTYKVRFREGLGHRIRLPVRPDRAFEIISNLMQEKDISILAFFSGGGSSGVTTHRGKNFPFAFIDACKWHRDIEDFLY